MSRSISLPLPVPGIAAGKIRISERPLGAVRSAFGAIGGPLAAGYLRSVEPIALCAQRVFGVFGLRKAQYFVWEFRVDWRKWFEDKVCAISYARTIASIDIVLDFYADMGYLLPPRPGHMLYSHLMDVLSGDTAFVSQMIELQKMPIGARALQQRLLALDAAVEAHMPAVAHEVVMSPGVTSGGAQ